MTNPTPEEIRASRHAAGLTQTQAAKLIHSTLRTYQDQEYGIARMHGATWELFLIATKQISSKPAIARYKNIAKPAIARYKNIVEEENLQPG